MPVEIFETDEQDGIRVEEGALKFKRDSPRDPGRRHDKETSPVPAPPASASGEGVRHPVFADKSRP
jgi:hypothetical protein